jgi:sugar phosphate isomerase/epimerase
MICSFWVADGRSIPVISNSPRYELCHLKDYKREGNPAIQQDLGKGVVNYKHILRTVMDNGMKHFLVEQEQYPTSPIARMKADSDYMKKLTI